MDSSSTMYVSNIRLVSKNTLTHFSYALFTTTWNVGGVLSDAISTNLLRVWDVSKATMENGDLSGIFKLSMLTTALQTLPILFVGMVPHGVEELNQLRCSQGSSVNRSRVGGTMFLSTVMLALLYAVFVGIMNIFRPGTFSTIAGTVIFVLFLISSLANRVDGRELSSNDGLIDRAILFRFDAPSKGVRIPS